MILLITLALAGKLEDGWRGIPYGPAAVLDTAPTSDCTKDTEPGVLWVCRETVADVPVTVSYMADEGIYTGVMINAKGYSACKVLFDTLTVAWPMPFTQESEYDRSTIPDGFWNLSRYKVTTAAAWSYNQFSGECHASTLNARLTEVVAAKKKAAAAAAAEAL